MARNIITRELRYIPESLDYGSAIRLAKRVAKQYGVLCNPLGRLAPKGVSPKYPDFQRFDYDIQAKLHPPKEDSVLMEVPERPLKDMEWLDSLPADLSGEEWDELQNIGYDLQAMIHARGSDYATIVGVDPESVYPLTPEELYVAIDWLKARPEELP